MKIQQNTRILMFSAAVTIECRCNLHTFDWTSVEMDLNWNDEMRSRADRVDAAILSKSDVWIKEIIDRWSTPGRSCISAVDEIEKDTGCSLLTITMHL